MGQTCCSQKSVENSQTLMKDDNNTQPELDRINSKQDLPVTDDTATKNGKTKCVEKQASIQGKSNRVATLDNEKDEGSYIVKSKKDEKGKDKSSQLDNPLTAQGNNTSEFKKVNHTLPADEWDTQSKKKQNENNLNKSNSNKNEGAIDLFMDLPGPPPNLREINKKSAPKHQGMEKNDKSD